MNSDILGVWSLSSWLQVASDGTTQPYCERAVGGFLHYSEDGTMAVSIYEADTQVLLSTYSGLYEMLDGEVVHRPLVGWSPGGLHELKRRYLKLRQRGLTMTTPPFEVSGQVLTYRLEWTKIS